MCKDKKVKDTCGTKSYATCVFYEGDVSENSSLVDETCVVVEEVIEDIYSLLGEIDTSTDVSDFGEDSCIEYEAEGDELTILDILTKHGEELCELKESVEGGDSNSSGSGGSGEGSATLESLNLDLDLRCLELDCDEISDLNQLFQALVNKVCELQEIVENDSPAKSMIL